MNKLEQIHEGKAKKVFLTDEQDHLILKFKDYATAAGGLKRSSIRGKGVLNNRISNELMQLLQQNGIPTHFVREIAPDETLVKRLQMLPLEVIVRNKAAGSLSRRFHLPEGTLLKKPVLEFDYLNEALGDPMVTTSHILALKLATAEQVQIMKDLAERVNAVLLDYFGQIGIDLIDFKLEFGTDENGQIVLADEISPDTSRLWDSNTHERLDKDRFRNDLGDVAEGYREVFDRIMALRNAG